MREFEEILGDAAVPEESSLVGWQHVDDHFVLFVELFIHPWHEWYDGAYDSPVGRWTTIAIDFERADSVEGAEGDQPLQWEPQEPGLREIVNVVEITVRDGAFVLDAAPWKIIVKKWASV